MMKPHDRTRTALTRQLKGLKLSELEITTHGPDRSFVEIVTPAALLQMLPTLKKRNQAGCNLYVRGPRDRDHDLVLLDDINRFTPDKMKSAGHDPAVVIETSPGNLQAWISLGRPCDAEVRHEIARELSRIYGSDPAAVDPHQSGRLAGFTNRKPEHKGPRGFPYVLLLNAPGKPAPEADALIRSATATIKKRKHDQALSASTSISTSNGFVSDDAARSWTDHYRERGGDLSEIDFAICCQLLKRGIDPDDLAATLEEVADRKGKYAANYAERTVAAAMKSLDNDSPSYSL